MSFKRTRMTVLILIILTLTLLFAGCQSANNALSVNELLDLGEKYLLEHNYEQALIQFTAVIDIEPMNPRAYTGGAEAYIGLGETEKAIDILKKGLLIMQDNKELSDLLSEIELNNIQVENTDQSENNPESDFSQAGDGFSEYKQFGYENFSYDFEWGDDSWAVQYNEGAIGGCNLHFTVTGEISEVGAVLIAAWSMENWTNEAIQEQADFIISIWKNEGINTSGFDGIVDSGFPIDPDELGKAEWILLFVLDKECEALGYIIVPVQIPSSVD